MSIADKLTTIAENEQKVYDAGNNHMLNVLTFNQTRVSYDYLCNRGNWDNVIYPEGYKIKPSSTRYMFYDYKGTFIPDIFDFSDMRTDAYDAYHSHMFDWAGRVEVMPDLNIPAIHNYYYVFSNMSRLKEIKIIRCVSTTLFQNTFTGSAKLESITFEGVIGNSLDLSMCPLLTVETLRNIIDCLDTKASGTYTLNIGDTNIAKLTAEELETIQNKGWKCQ